MGEKAAHEITSFRGKAGSSATATATATVTAAAAAALWWRLSLISVFGGVLLIYWLMTFHPANEQLWMVPVGLVLFTTPVVIWFSDFASTV